MSATLAAQRPATLVLGRRVTLSPRLRAVVLVLGLLVVYRSAFRYTYVGLFTSFDPTGPLVFVPFVPFAALAVASTGWRGIEDEPEALPQRGADVIVAGFLFLLAWIAAHEGPYVFSTETLAWRADLLSLVPLAAGLTALLFGARTLFRLRAAVLLLTAMSPATYRVLLVPCATGSSAPRSPPSAASTTCSASSVPPPPARSSTSR